MAEQRFIIEHEDGRQYSVTREGFEELYESEGFVIVRPEGDVAAPVKPKRGRKVDEPASDEADAST